MQLIPFQAVYPNLSLIASPESFFGTVKNQYTEYQASGFFKKAARESIYISKIESEQGNYTGIITCTHIDDFRTGKVLKHENTLAAKEQQMMHVVLQNKAMVKPILLAYEGVKELDNLLDEIVSNNEPFFTVDFKEAGESHTIWDVNDGLAIERIRELFVNKIPKSYIADGHHRSSTAVALYETNHHVYDRESMKGVLSIYIPFKQLNIFDYNRVLEIFQYVDPIQFVVKLSKYCKIKPLKHPCKPSSKYEMTMVMGKKWYRLRWRKKFLVKDKDSSVLLDAALLNKYILKDICNISNVREDRRVKYVDGVSGTFGMTLEVEKNPHRVGFCLFPLSIDELKSVADHGETLPPKSTWFEPRVKNGMIVKEL